mgnify:FL=1
MSREMWPDHSYLGYAILILAFLVLFIFIWLAVFGI